MTPNLPETHTAGRLQYLHWRTVGVPWLLERIAGFTESVDADEWDRVAPALEGLKNVEADWDGEGAEPPNHACIDGAIRFTTMMRAAGLPAPDAIYPHCSGEIFVEWSFGYEPGKTAFVQVSAEVHPQHPDVASVLVSYGTDKPTEFGDIPIVMEAKQ